MINDNLEIREIINLLIFLIYVKIKNKHVKKNKTCKKVNKTN